MTSRNEKALLAVGGLALAAQLVIRSLRSDGRMSPGPAYTAYLIVLSAITFVAVLLVYLGRRASG